MKRCFLKILGVVFCFFQAGPSVRGPLKSWYAPASLYGQASQPLNAINHKIEIPEQMRLKLEFWKAIYTKYTTRQGLLHDSEDLSVIYDAIELPARGGTRAADEIRHMIRERLFNIVRRGGKNLTREERELLSRFPQGTTRARLLQATENIRFQLGQADRFRQGIIRSGHYLKHIEKIVHDMGMPDYLKYLPHVESSFQEFAISKFGAAGLWQLMEATGRDFKLRINYTMDERLDPWIATVAAMNHLKRDYKFLGQWPLALTAYNHGPGGVRKAMRAIGTDDISEIVFRYSSPSFGFASRNFYAQFMAAVEVASNYTKYFGALPIKPTLVFESFKTKKPIYLRDLQRDYTFTMEQFKSLNPGLRPPVLANNRAIPVDTLIRVPPNSKKSQTLVASVDRRQSVKVKPKISRIEDVPELKTSTPTVATVSTMAPKSISPYKVSDLKDRSGWIRVAINENLSSLAEWAGVDKAEVRKWNGLESHEQVRLGQKVVLKFEKQSASDFEAARSDYHQKIREDFFSQYEITNLQNYEVKRGENLWSLCNQKFDIPAWLLQEYNPKISVVNLNPGTKLKIPMLRERDMSQVVASQDP